MRIVGCAGNPADPNTFGGIPFHFLQAAKATGMEIEGAYRYAPGVLKFMSRAVWTIEQLIKQGDIRGYQYSNSFLKSNWPSHNSTSGIDVAINLFQLFPTHIQNSNISKFFYIDQTLYDLFYYYNIQEKLSDNAIKSALEREGEQYRRAKLVIFQANWAAQRALQFYELDPRKVHVVIPGANLDEHQAKETFDPVGEKSLKPGEQLRIIFVGKDWRRKGLARLLRAIQLTGSQKRRFAVTVIGTPRSELSNELLDGIDVNFLGFLDKRTEQKRFQEALSNSHIGCLLSDAEAGGFSLREFGRAGLPSFVPKTGGSPEFLDADSSILISPEADDRLIAEELRDLASNPTRLNSMISVSQRKKHEYTWDYAVAEINRLIKANID